MRRPDSRTLSAVLAPSLLALCACAPAPDRTRFATPEQAAQAVMHGFRANDIEELKAIFGAGAEKDLSSGDPTSDRHDRETIALAMEQSWRWEPLAADRQELVVGDEEWPFPIPLARAGDGWQFDTDAGREEMLSRRIGRNELRVIELCRAYVDVQQEYASRPRDGRRAGLFAQKIRSAPGRQDGLYWKPGPGERPSPLGDLAARAASEGYGQGGDSPQPFLGYHLRVLTAQGEAAKGGARSYVVDGEMTGGFGLVAYPAEYGRSGVMTFIVNQDGVVYEADLSEDTARLASGLQAFDPDDRWSEVEAAPSS
jgi:hypothetical protein